MSHHHDHDHHHGHDHAHEHHHGHAHDHDHGHSHPHEHGHAHPHDHEHLHDHGHDHTHDQAHEHTHVHDHPHDHDHGHAHEHDGDTPSCVHSQKVGTMPFDQQLRTLFAHWIRHNDSHAGTYSDWALKARAHGMEKTADLLSEIADMTAALNLKIDEAARSLD